MKKLILIVLPLLIIGGSVIGLGMAGVVNIPGLTPKKKPTTTVAAKKVEEKKKAPAQKKPKPAPTVKASDPSKGEEAVAKLWNEMDLKALLPITEKWKDAELAAILSKMDNEKVVELLSAMKAERAVTLTRAIKKIAEQNG